MKNGKYDDEVCPKNKDYQSFIHKCIERECGILLEMSQLDILDMGSFEDFSNADLIVLNDSYYEEGYLKNFISIIGMVVEKTSIMKMNLKQLYFL